MNSYGWRAIIYEVAQNGAYGTIPDVEKVNIYDFFNYLSFIRTQSARLNERK